MFSRGLPNWNIQCLLNPRWPWISKFENLKFDSVRTIHDFVPEHALEHVDAVVLFSSQPMVTTCHLIEQATLKSIPVIAIQEVYQMMLEQGYVNEYYVPVDHFFVSSNYEKEKFLEIGYAPDSIAATGSVFLQRQEDISASECRQRIGLKGERPVATLSLAYLTPSGETWDIRKKMLELVQEGLPQEYDLLVKPHPNEWDSNCSYFIKQYAPRAHVVDQYISIHHILKVTSVLLIRGTSQVAIQALQQGIFVIPIPLGRPTFFDGMPTNILVQQPPDIPRVLEMIRSIPHEKLYQPIFNKYLDISFEKAKNNVFSKICEIIERRQVNYPYERTVELILFWMWMGFEFQARRLLNRAKEQWSEKENELKRLDAFLGGHFSRDDFLTFQKQFPRKTGQWILQALQIKSLFLKGEKMDTKMSDLFLSFPPFMNQEYFFPFMNMLGWLYGKSGMVEKLQGLCKDSFEKLNCYKSMDSFIKYKSVKHRMHLILHYEYNRLKYTFYFRVKNIFFMIKKWYADRVSI